MLTGNIGIIQEQFDSVLHFKCFNFPYFSFEIFFTYFVHNELYATKSELWSRKQEIEYLKE